MPKGDGLALSATQRAMLDREHEEIACNPGDGITLAQLKERLISRPGYQHPSPETIYY